MQYRALRWAREKFDRLARWWVVLPLEKQFAVAAAIVLLAGMLSIGWWVANRISRSVIENTAAAAALYLDSSVAPLIQELAETGELTTATQAKLDLLMVQPTISERIIAMNIWRLDGKIVYSRWKELIGKTFLIRDSFSRAMAGNLAAQIDDIHDEHDAHSRAISADLLEIYAPVRETHSRRVIAVSEFYISAEKLRLEVRREVLSSWLIVGHVSFFMLAALWGIVARGGRVIDEQRHKLAAQVGELRVLLARNEELGARLRRSNATAADANEQFLRRIGADLHDGPAQLLSYTLLRLHKFAPLVERYGGEKERLELSLMRDALRDTFREVRNISEGLTLPELEPITLGEVIELAVTSHERLTNTLVSRELDLRPENVPTGLKVCVYRLVQEGLANAFRHASGSNQQVTAHGQQTIEIVVSDGGPGFDAGRPRKGGLGLAGLRARMEAIGGTLEVCSVPGKGTRLVAYFDLSRIRREGVIVG